MNYNLGNVDPNRATCLKSGNTFPEVGKKIIHQGIKQSVAFKYFTLVADLAVEAEFWILRD